MDRERIRWSMLASQPHTSRRQRLSSSVNDGGHRCSHVNEGLAVGPSNHIVRACIACLSYVQSCVVLLLYGASAAG